MVKLTEGRSGRLNGRQTASVEKEHKAPKLAIYKQSLSYARERAHAHTHTDTNTHTQCTYCISRYIAHHSGSCVAPAIEWESFCPVGMTNEDKREHNLIHTVTQASSIHTCKHTHTHTHGTHTRHTHTHSHTQTHRHRRTQLPDRARLSGRM